MDSPDHDPLAYRTFRRLRPVEDDKLRVRIFLDHELIQRTVQRAIDNRSGRSVSGPVMVRVDQRAPLTDADLKEINRAH